MNQPSDVFIKHVVWSGKKKNETRTFLVIMVYYLISKENLNAKHTKTFYTVFVLKSFHINQSVRTIRRLHLKTLTTPLMFK